MTILVTGGAGYIGSHVVRLGEAGHKIIIYDDLSTGYKDALINNEKLIIGNIADEVTLGKIFNDFDIKTVFHFAASSIVSESISDPIKYYKNNSVNFLNFLNCCIKHQVSKFVFSSTATVYGIQKNYPIDEKIVPVPINPYGNSKYMCELILNDLALVHPLRYVILRYFNVAGADPLGRMGQRTRNATYLINLCCQTALKKSEHLNIYGTDYDTPDGTCIRDYIHVEDLSCAHLATLNYLNENNPSVTLNVGYGKGYSVREVINLAQQILGVSFVIKETERRLGDPPYLVASVEKIRKLFDWKPLYADLDKIIFDTWQWEKKLFSQEKI